MQNLFTWLRIFGLAQLTENLRFIMKKFYRYCQDLEIICGCQSKIKMSPVTGNETVKILALKYLIANKCAINTSNI